MDQRKFYKPRTARLWTPEGVDRGRRAALHPDTIASGTSAKKPGMAWAKISSVRKKFFIWACVSRPLPM